MPYRTLVAKSVANRAAALSELWNMITSMGWELHDNEDASSYRVYRSNGELGDRLTEYLRIDWINANTIRIMVYYWWDASANTGIGYVSAGYSITTSESPFLIWIYGDKNIISIISKVGATYTHISGGHVPNRIWSTPETTLTSAISSGATVLPVANTSNFRVGGSYQLINVPGASAMRRERVTISSISGNNITISAGVGGAYNSGAVLGATPSAFAVWQNDFNAYMTNPFNAVGSMNSVISLSISAAYPVSSLDPDFRGNAWGLQPLLFREGPDCIVGYSGNNMYMINGTGFLSEDTFTVNTISSGTSTGNNTSTTLNDTTKAWEDLTNKVVVITSGTGAGQIRKILSNTATSLTIDAWVTLPDNTSGYVICEEAFRGFVINSVLGYVFKEGV